MNSVHIILAGKGGVGKSLVSVFVAQYLAKEGGQIACADTDPVTPTFIKYASLDVAHIAITENGNVMQRKFDPLMEMIISTEADYIIDTGSGTFLAFTKYLSENDIYEIMAKEGKKIFIHTIVVSGQSKSETYDGVVALLDKVNKFAKVVVWENEFWGAIDFDGHPITASKPYKEAEKAGKIAGLVKIIDRSQSDTFMGDMKQMTSNNMTLNDVLTSPDFNFLAKNRLKKVVGDVFAELDKVTW